jgi:hypothetical protein
VHLGRRLARALCMRMGRCWSTASGLSCGVHSAAWHRSSGWTTAERRLRARDPPVHRPYPSRVPSGQWDVSAAAADDAPPAVGCKRYGVTSSSIEEPTRCEDTARRRTASQQALLRDERYAPAACRCPSCVIIVS